MNTCEKRSFTLFLCLILPAAYGEAKPSCDADLVDSTGDLHMLQANAKKVLPRRTPCTKVLKPKLMLLGMGHSGSTTFAELLNRHPELSYGLFKEPHSFCSGKPHDVPPSYRTDLDYVNNHYKVSCNVSVTFDATPCNWLLGSKSFPGWSRTTPGVESVQHVKRLLGSDVKFILLIKDPVRYLASKIADPGSSTQSLKKGEGLACIADSLDSWLEVFPRKQFLFIDTSFAFGANLTRTLDKMIGFAGVSPRTYDVPLDFAVGRRRNTQPANSSYAQQFHASKRNRDCKHRLEEQTGMEFSWQDSP